MEVGKQTTPDGLRELSNELKLLASQCLSWIEAWRAWPHRLRAVHDYVQAKGTATDPAAQSLTSEVKQLISDYLRQQDLMLTPAQTPEFGARLALLIEESKRLSDHQVEGSLYLELHGQLENLVNRLVQVPAALADRCDRCAQQARYAPQEHREAVLKACEQIREAALSWNAERLAASYPSLEALLPHLPVRPLKVQWLGDSRQVFKKWLVIAVEDDPVWQGIIRRTLDLAEQQVAPDFEVDYEILSDRQAGEKRLKELTARAVGGERKNAPHTGLIAVLDLGLPGSSGQGPVREHGRELLRFARKSSVNIPVIVLTTAPNFLADHLVAAELGVSDYLLKGAESEQELLQALIGRMTARQRRKVRVREETDRLIYVEDVEIRLNPRVFRTFSVLADAAPRAVTVERAVELLEEKYGGYFNLVNEKAEVDQDTGNLRRLWTAASQERPRAENRVTLFREEKVSYALWKKLLVQMEAAGTSPNDLPAIAEFLDQRYGQEKRCVEVFDPENIKKHVSEIRREIILAFNATQQTIIPEEEVLANATFQGQFAYKVVAQVQLDDPEAEEKPVAHQFRVLVVENDVEHWQPLIRDLLWQFGYDVRVACCEDEGVEVAREFQPDLLCLDMNMPRNLEAFHRNPPEETSEAGLNVLERVTAFLPDVRALIFTDYINRDHIRDRAGQTGVRVTDFVAKRDDPANPWQAELVLKVHRIEQEMRRHATLPLPGLLRLPYLQFWRSRENYLEVFNRPWQPKPLEFKLLLALAENDNLPVITEELVYIVYGTSDKKEALDQLVKRLRPRIAHEWFGLADYSQEKDKTNPEAKQAKEVAEAVLANDAKAGLVLNARVVIQK